MDPLIITRGQFRLTVVCREGRFSLRASGGGNVIDDEYAKIAAHVGDGEEAARFLAKIRARMER